MLNWGSAGVYVLFGEMARGVGTSGGAWSYCERTSSAFLWELFFVGERKLAASNMAKAEGREGGTDHSTNRSWLVAFFGEGSRAGCTSETSKKRC